MLLSELLGSQQTLRSGPILDHWKNIYEPTVFIVGKADDLSYFDYAPAIQAIYGSATPSLQDLADPARLATFQAAIDKMPSPLINSMYVWLLKIRAAYGAKLGSIAISRADYIRHQVFAWYFQYRIGALGLRAVLNLFRKLSPSDWLWLALSPFDTPSRTRLLTILTRHQADRMQSSWRGLKPLESVSDIKEFAAFVTGLA